MLTYIRNIVRREEGATAVEYGLMVAAIAAVIVVIVFALGGLVKNAFSTTCTKIASGSSTSASGCTG